MLQTHTVRAICVLLLALGATTHAVEVTFNDPNLEQAVRDLLLIPSAPIQDTDVDAISFLDIHGHGITDLTGLEFFDALEVLTAQENNISSIAPLGGLPVLTVLDINGSPVTDVSPLFITDSVQTLSMGKQGSTIDLSFAASMPQLVSLSILNSDVTNAAALAALTVLEQIQLVSTNISDISALAGATLMRNFTVISSGVSDISMLGGLTAIETFTLTHSNLTDISVVANFNNLSVLDLIANDIADLSPVAGLFGVVELYVGNNPFSSVAPLAGLSGLENLYLGNSDVADLTPLVGLTNLVQLSIGFASVTDIDPLSAMTNLRELNMNNNAISDLTPLIGMTNLEFLRLSSNQIESVAPLVINAGIGSGDLVELLSNPLDQTSLCTDIPALEARGAIVEYVGTCGEAPLPCPLWPVMDGQGRDAYDAIELDWQMDDPAGDGIPDRWQVRLVAQSLCHENHPLHELTDDAYRINQSLLLNEPSPTISKATIENLKELISALLLVSQETQDSVIAFLGLTYDYEVVDGFTKAPNEPYAGDGDLDGDGNTNLQEYQNIVINGGTIDQFAWVAFDNELNGTEQFPAAGFAALMGLAVTITVLGAARLCRRDKRIPLR